MSSASFRVETRANGLQLIIRGVNPELVIPSHENEMSHVVSHREEYTQDHERLFGLNHPFIVIAWGEGYRYERSAAMRGRIPDED